MTEATVKRPRLLPPHYFALAVISMWVLHRLIPGPRLIRNHWNWFGLVPIILGGVLSAYSADLFDRVETGVIPFSDATTLVVRGPFRFSRNPMYLGMLIALVGISVLMATSSQWVVLPLFFGILDRLFVAREEVFLTERFGEPYGEYQRRVRRWL
ncbi:MAG: isoprenylcysteine carboxylmethyltransferase family protein [Thermoanaerobaculia bacterium]